MPIVPVEENKVGLAGLTDAKLRPADYGGSGLEALGAGLAGVGKAGAELADSLPGQAEAKRRHAELLRTDLAAKQAWNEGHEANAALLDGFRQLKGKDARDALAPVAEAMAQNLHAVRQGHEDAHVRAIIDGTLAHRTAQDIMDLHAHANAQDTITQAQESERLVANAATDALRHADDPTRFDHAIATGENTLRRQGQLAGKPEAAIDGEIAVWRSARYVAAVHALAPNDGLGATALSERYRDQLTPADRAALEPLLHEPMAQTQAIADIDTAALAAAPFAPLTPQGDPLLADRMRTITSHFDRVVLPELMQRYGGDGARAWAATQIGTDAVDDLVKRHGDGWYQALPETARHAVAHNFALLNADTSSRTAPQDRAAVEASLAGLDDTRRGYAQRELTLRSNRADQARRAAQGAAADQAYELAEQLGHDFTSLGQLPAKVRADLSDQTATALQRQADSNIDPQPVAPEGMVSLALRNMAATAPDAFRDLDMREYRPLVSADEYAMFERLQRGVGRADGASAPIPSSHDQNLAVYPFGESQRRAAYYSNTSEAMVGEHNGQSSGRAAADKAGAAPAKPASVAGPRVSEAIAINGVIERPTLLSPGHLRAHARAIAAGNNELIKGPNLHVVLFGPGVTLLPVPVATFEEFDAAAKLSSRLFGLDSVITGAQSDYLMGSLGLRGQSVVDGRVYGNSARDRYYFGTVVGRDGVSRLEFGKGDPPRTGVKVGFGGGIPLLIDGKDVPGYNIAWRRYDESLQTGKNIVAYNSENNTAAIFIQPHGSDGNSLGALRKYIREAGYNYAIMFDGSGSTSLNFRGKQVVSPQLIRQPLIVSGIGFKSR